GVACRSAKFRTPVETISYMGMQNGCSETLSLRPKRRNRSQQRNRACGYSDFGIRALAIAEERLLTLLAAQFQALSGHLHHPTDLRTYRHDYRQPLHQHRPKSSWSRILCAAELRL